MKPPYVPCSRCRGTGLRPMPRVALEALTAVPIKGERSTADIATAMAISHTAACNRLRWLELRGFVARNGTGHRYDACLWRRVRSQPAESKAGGSDG